MTIEFNCPHCDKTLKTSDDKAGRQAKCPGCGEVIGVPQSLGDNFHDVVLAEEVGSEPGSSTPPPVPSSSDDTKRCPMCGEQIKAAAIRCRHCGEVFESSDSESQRLSGRREMRPFPPGEVIADAWRIYTERMGLLIGAFLATGLLTVIAVVIGWMPFVVAELLFDRGHSVEGFVAASVGVVCVILVAGFSFYIQSGYLVLQVKAAREQPAEFGDLFSGGRFFGRMLLNSILFGLLINIGSLACLLPGLLLGLMFWPFGHVLVDEDRPGIESLTRAKELTDGNWGSLFIVLITAFACIVAGYCACGVGLIFAMPFVNVLYAVTYDRMTCQSSLNSSDEA